MMDLEPLIANDAVLIEHECAGIGDALLVGLDLSAKVRRVLRQVLIQQAQPADDRAALVREQRVSDAPFLREGGQHLY